MRGYVTNIEQATLDNEDYLIMRETDILGIVN